MTEKEIAKMLSEPGKRIPEEICRRAEEIFSVSVLGHYSGGHGMPSLGASEFFKLGYYASVLDKKTEEPFYRIEV